MTLAAIAVHVDFDAQAEDRIKLAADLAGRFDARLIGVAGWPLRQWEAPEHSRAEHRRSEQAERAKVLEELQRLGESFRRSAGDNPRGVEWRSSVHFPSEVLARQARAADLVIIGKDRLPGDVYHTFDPGAVILAPGRPVLLAPSGRRRLEASRVLVAWKDSREARRALADALPLLERAESVLIVAVAPQELEATAKEQVADVAGYLQHHGIVAAEQIAALAHEPEGDVLLRAAARHSADLIVAGAYGRSRLSEWMFGGVTRRLMTKGDVACLLSN